MAAGLSEPISGQEAPAATRSMAVPWSILSALGGAVLAFFGQVAFEEYRASRDAEAKAVEAVQQGRQQQTQLLDVLFNEYLALGDQADRAGEYIDSGHRGSKEDILAVVRHFRKLIAYVVNERLEARAAVGYYAGRLQYWSEHLRSLGSGRSPIAGRFSDDQRRNYLILADALGNLAGDEVVHRASAISAPDSLAAPGPTDPLGSSHVMIEPISRGGQGLPHTGPSAPTAGTVTRSEVESAAGQAGDRDGLTAAERLAAERAHHIVAPRPAPPRGR